MYVAALQASGLTVCRANPFKTAMFMITAAPIIVIAGGLFWTTFDRRLDADKVFPTMTILYLVEEPLGNILNYYPNVMSTMACIRRMQDYLLLEEIPGVSQAEVIRASRHSEAAEKNGLVEIGQRRLRAPLPTTEEHVVRFFNASIAPARGKRAVLSGVNINVTRGTLTMITSATGAGKTTLLRAIIGGADILSGSMHVDPRMGYSGQQPWIRNTTVRKNIISEYMFDPVWYAAVVKACQLEEDIRQFPDGDQFNAGSGGVNLSGGQRLRLVRHTRMLPLGPYLNDPLTSNRLLREPFILAHPFCFLTTLLPAWTGAQRRASSVGFLVAKGY